MEEVSEFLTIGKGGAGEYREKGSKFLSFVYRVKNVEAVQQQLDMLRAEYHDARHHCYAYILGYDGSRFRANDDGEPSHSAGDPILGQLRSQQLTQVLCVVIRYFGGTKLGVGGLIHAYRTAAAEALAQSVIITEEVKTKVEIIYPYESTNEVMRMVDEFSMEIADQEFGQDCHMFACVNVARQRQLEDKADLLVATGTPLTLKIIPEIPS